jgi:hypothetical protein
MEIHSWIGRARQVTPQAVEEHHFLGVKLHVGSGQTSRQLLRFCGPDNCRGDGRLRQHPCHLHQRLAAFLEKGFEAIDRLKLRVLPVRRRYRSPDAPSVKRHARTELALHASETSTATSSLG